MRDVELGFYEILIREEIENLCENGRFFQTVSHMQHGDISVFEHSVGVAFMSVLLARTLHVKLQYMILIRGALLHDYFLYDWHERDKRHFLHGFRHARRAMLNACEDYELTALEKNIILRHMFPLTIIPPACREAWIVCLADKICALMETLHLSNKRYREYFQMALRES